MSKTDYLNGSINPINGFKCLKEKFLFNKEHPEYFTASGLLTFCGSQGSGKTLSLVNYVKQISKDFPKVVIVSNIELKGFPKELKIIYYSNINQLFRLFDEVKNGYAGVVYIVDEIQILFNSLLRRSQNVSVLEAISQQRKQRKHIIGTAQVFTRIDKVFREQMENVVVCKNYFGVLQFNKTIDGTEVAETSDGGYAMKIKKRHLWFHTPELYNSYDTSAVISAYREEFVNSELSDEAYDLFKKMLGGINNE